MVVVSACFTSLFCSGTGLRVLVLESFDADFLPGFLSRDCLGESQGDLGTCLGAVLLGDDLYRELPRFCWLPQGDLLLPDLYRVGEFLQGDLRRGKLRLESLDLDLLVSLHFQLLCLLPLSSLPRSYLSYRPLRLDLERSLEDRLRLPPPQCPRRSPRS